MPGSCQRCGDVTVRLVWILDLDGLTLRCCAACWQAVDSKRYSRRLALRRNGWRKVRR